MAAARSAGMERVGDTLACLGMKAASVAVGRADQLVCRKSPAAGLAGRKQFAGLLWMVRELSVVENSLEQMAVAVEMVGSSLGHTYSLMHSKDLEVVYPVGSYKVMAY